MKKYLEHVRSKEPHERRKHAMRLSGIIVGVFFIAWLTTFSARLATPPASQDTGGDTSQTASAANSTLLDQSQGQDQAQLEVSTTSVYSY